METVDNTKELLKDLRSLQKKHDHGLQKSEGITVRPRIACTNAAEKALQLKRKYKQLRLQASKYNSLPEKQRGRPRFNAVYRNRVGKKAATKREVYIYITCNKIYKLILASMSLLIIMLYRNSEQLAHK